MVLCSCASGLKLAAVNTIALGCLFCYFNATLEPIRQHLILWLRYHRGIVTLESLYTRENRSHKTRKLLLETPTLLE
jgi:hypothetical protein